MDNQTKPQSKPTSPLAMFFKLGDWVTKGDMNRKMDFDYYMLWIIFLAFFFVFSGNIYRFFTNGYQLANLGWALFGFAIMWFQYFNLKTMWSFRKQKKEAFLVSKESTVDDKIESVSDMKGGFE